MPLPANTLAELHREMTRLQLIGRQMHGEIETARLERLTRQPNAGAHPMIRLLTQVRGVGVETADLLANEAFARPLRDERAVARYGGLGRTARPTRAAAGAGGKELARAGNARIRSGMIQLAWRFLMFQKDSQLGPMVLAPYRRCPWRHPQDQVIVAVARKLLVSLWRLATTGEVPEGVVLRPAL